MALVAVLTCLSISAPVSAMTAQELFDEGNRLFRDELYWAALLRYRQAEQQGMDTALLHYNTGIANYRAKQHARAKDAFLKAERSSSLRVVTHYNLGLNAFAAGELDEALRWFRQARDQEENEKIASYARRAITRVRLRQQSDEPSQAPRKTGPKQKDFTEIELHADIGFGNDGNIFRSPSEPYVDLARRGDPLITPVVQSGAFMPIDLGAKYVVNSFEHESFFGAYRLKGRYYQDQELDSGNEFLHEFSFGSEYDRREDNRRRRVFSAFRIAQHDETYFDRDDGLAREVGGVDISDRSNYLRYGPDLRFRQSHERLSFGILARGYLYNYEDVEVVPEYDHEYFLFGLHTQYRFTRTSLLRVNVEKYSRRYGDRPSYNLDGEQLIDNPTVRYDYLQVALLARQRITRNMWFGVQYERTDRVDRFEGYNSYIRDHYEFEFHWSLSRRFDIDLSAYYRNYNYENAFAFNEPTAGRKTLETAQGSLTARYEMTRSLSLILEATMDESASSDPRIEYSRTQFMVSVRWEP